MVYTAPIEATPEYLKRLVERARSPHLFLSVYMPEGQEVTTTEALRIRLKDLLDEIQMDLEGTSWEEPFQEERRLVEDYARTLRPGGPGLVVLSSREAREWHALWLPDTVEEHVRFGRGAYVLPLLDVLDEFEPVGVAVVGRDRARVMGALRDSYGWLPKPVVGWNSPCPIGTSPQAEDVHDGACSDCTTSGVPAGACTERGPTVASRTV